MKWDRLLDEALRTASERETQGRRQQYARVTLRRRLAGLAEHGPVTLHLACGTIRASVEVVGSDVVVVRPEGAAGGELAVAIARIDEVIAPEAGLVATVHEAHDPSPALSERLTLDQILRVAARRRLGTRITLGSGTTITGTIDRVGADHLDIALHDAGSPRRRSAVAGHRIVALDALCWVALDGTA